MSTTQARQPAASPVYILRGHAAQIHALHIFANNLRLISADADGWIVVWDLVLKRPVAVWKAHDGAVLEVKGFSRGGDAATEVFTHGRDHKLRLWRFRVQDEEFLQKTLPVDVSEESRSSTPSQPWLVHSLPVNALNFCAFSVLFIDGLVDSHEAGTPQSSSSSANRDATQSKPSLIAVPNALDSGAVDIFHLPMERRICTIPTDPAVKTGMVMAVNLFTASTGELHLVSAYEDGHVMAFALRGKLNEKDLAPGATAPLKWEKIYASRPHSQPALSIDVHPSHECFFSSAADALLVKHPIPQFSHGSALLQGPVDDSPLKAVDTKHSGQQGLCVRSDGKILATAGWDSRVRVYSCKTMKELAVLKWHKDGCYALAFADVSATTLNSSDVTTLDKQPEAETEQLTRRSDESFSLASIQNQRNLKVQNTHWLAAGSKDGKVSLWDIY